MNMFVNETTFNDTQQRILNAAIECVKQWGIEKTSLNDIAKQAGVTRTTVYSYFESKDQVIRTALLQSGYAFAERLKQHIAAFKKPQSRLLESIIFAVEELPKEPYLTLITQANLSAFVNEDALNEPEAQQICLEIFRDIFRNEIISDTDLVEYTEFTTRLVLSLLTLKGPIERDSSELRGFLKRRLLPALGL